MSEPQEKQAVWMPAVPAALATFVVSVFFPPLGILVGLVALVTLLVRMRRGRWSALTYACFGSVVGILILILFALVSHAVHASDGGGGSVSPTQSSSPS